MYSKIDIDWDNINKYQNILCLPEEVWVTMVGIAGDQYDISNYGRCRREPYKNKSYFVKKISDNGAGYKRISTSLEGKTKFFYVHRMVAIYFLPNPENLPQVNHTRYGLGKHDNRCEFLEWCTEKDNILDAHANGQMDYRTKVKTSIDIKPDNFVEKMYREYKLSGKVAQTSRKFGVPRTSLSSIVNKRSRRKITDPIDLEFK